MKRAERIRLQAERERARDFSAHILPTCGEKHILPVPDDYDYLKRGFFRRLLAAFSVGVFRFVGLFVGPFCRFRVEGKRNLRNVKRAILTCNHVSIADCILVRRAVGRKKLKITVAEFNNRRGVFGALLRAGGTVPIGKTLPALRRLNGAVREFLRLDYLVLFYPEGSLWWCYEKPRPLIDGAFLSAARNGVPVVPMFFTFRPRGIRRDGTEKKAFTLHIGAPIPPDPDLPLRDAAKRMSELTWAFNRDTYERVYGKKLEYEGDEGTKIRALS